MVEFRLPKQNQYPKRIYFSNECYRIKFKKGLNCFGITDSEKKLITIKDGLSPRELLNTVIHELLHVIEFERPIKIKHKKIYKWERAIAELLIDNFL